MRLGVLAVAALLALPAWAGAQEITQVADGVPISAHGGWVVWSAKLRGAYRLFAWHSGLTRELRVAPKTHPFDLDVGSDTRGRPVVTFSRCDGYGTATVWAAREVGRACRLRVVDLLSGRERGAGVPEPRGVSDTMPSMWRGRVAFARRDPGHHGAVDQVMLWDPARGLQQLRHGAVPARCPYRRPSDCSKPPPSGEVLGLDLGARLVAFSWRVDAPDVIGHGGYEGRADRLSDGRSALVGTGYIGEACTGSTDGTSPAAPVVNGGRVWYSQSTTACYAVKARLFGFQGFPVRGRFTALTGTVLQAVKDGPWLDELVAPTSDSDTPTACTPCAIRRIAAPALNRVAQRPLEPFE
jgi:hypothetical protein